MVVATAAAAVVVVVVVVCCVLCCGVVWAGSVLHQGPNWGQGRRRAVPIEARLLDEPFHKQQRADGRIGRYCTAPSVITN